MTEQTPKQNGFERRAGAAELLRVATLAPQPGETMTPERMHAVVTIGHDREQFARTLGGIMSDALGHIRRICENSRTSSRRLRWVIQRAEWALAGKEYDREQFSLPETGRSYQSIKQELNLVKARYEVCRQIGWSQFFEDMSNGDGLIPRGEEFDAEIDAEIQKREMMGEE